MMLINKVDREKSRQAWQRVMYVEFFLLLTTFSMLCVIMRKIKVTELGKKIFREKNIVEKIFLEYSHKSSQI